MEKPELQFTSGSLVIGFPRTDPSIPLAGTAGSASSPPVPAMALLLLKTGASSHLWALTMASARVGHQRRASCIDCQTTKAQLDTTPTASRVAAPCNSRPPATPPRIGHRAIHLRFCFSVRSAPSLSTSASRPHQHSIAGLQEGPATG